MGNKKKTTIIRTVDNEKYTHIGLENQILKLGDDLNDVDELILIINIDRLPLFKSSKTCLWPILGCILNMQYEHVFIIGAYVGNEKPISIDTYLHDFNAELANLKNGIIYKEKLIKITILAFVCDAPARAFLTGSVGHNPLNGCSRCHQKGTRLGHRTSFRSTAGEKRTDESFRNRSNVNYHIKKYQNTQTELENIGIKMITQVAIDSMHLIDLGVTKNSYSQHEKHHK